VTRAAVVGVAMVLVLAAPRRAAAHDATPGVLAIDETAPGRFALGWTPPVDGGGVAAVTLTFPEPCVRTGDEVACRDGLRGTLRFADLPARALIVVTIRRLDGAVAEHLVHGDAPAIELAGRGRTGVAGWLGHGIEHILTGWDHLAFLLGLLLVLELRLDRRLLATLTAFTVAHSITLALAATDVVRVASAPVEASIAASVVLVAREALRDQPTALRRWPWLVAGAFGLVHGLGFAGALQAIDLPAGSLVTALVGFNVGVELGQLAVVLAVVAAARLLSRLVLDRHGGAAWTYRGVCYALGGLGACWLIGRVAVLLG